MVVPNTEAGRLWVYEQRLLELYSVWVGITALLAFGQWIWAKFPNSTLCGFFPPFPAFPPLLLLKLIYCFFSRFIFLPVGASSSLLLPAPSGLCLIPSLGSPCGRGGGPSPTAEQLSSQKSQEAVCASQHPCEIPRGDFHPASHGLFLT